MASGRAGALWPSVIFAVATLAFYWEIALPGRILADYDVWVYFYPLRSYAADAIWAGRFPLWNPDIFLGAPFFANPQTAMLYPGTALFYVLPVPYAFSLSIIGHVFLAVVFMYVFLRRSIAIQRMPALVGASAFGFGGFLSSQVGHINQLSASAWLPAIALCTDAAVRGRNMRWALAGALALAMQLLAGHAQETFMSLWVVGLILAWRLLDGSGLTGEGGSGTGPIWGQRLLTFAGRAGAVALAGVTVVGLGFGLAGVQLLPSAELGAHSVRAGGMSYAEATSFSMRPTEFFRSVLPGYWYNPTGENIGYVGGIGLAFAAFGVVFGRPGPMAFAVSSAALGLFLAFGGANPFYRQLLEIVPGLGLFRVPARWLFVYSFGVATLVGLGLDWACRRADRRPHQVSPAPFAIPPPDLPLGSGAGRVLLAIVMLGAVLVLGSIFPPNVPGRIALLWVVGLAAGFGLIVGILWGGARWLGAVAFMCLFLELWGASMDLPQRYPVPNAATESLRPVPAFLKAHVTEGRILSVAPIEYEIEDHADIRARYPYLSPEGAFELKSALKLDEIMSPNVPLKYHLATVDGYDGGVLPLRRYLSIARLLVPPSEMRSDGVLRTRLIALPSDQAVRLFDLSAVVAGRVADVELSGLRFDVATARTLRDGESLMIRLAGPVQAETIGLLGSVVSVSPLPSRGRMILHRADGSQSEVSLRVGQEVFLETLPGPQNVGQPTAGLSRGGRRDSAVRVSVPPGESVTAIEWRWEGPNPWDLRAATIVSARGEQSQLVLRPNVERIGFSNLKVYRVLDRESRVRLVPSAEVANDDDIVETIRSSETALLDRTVFLGSSVPASSTDRDSSRSQGGEHATSFFRRLDGPPERLVYERVEGSDGGYLVVKDAWFPGWRAEVDGQPTKVHRANVHFKAVEIPEGAKRVVLSYEPASVQLGGLVSLTSAFVLIGSLIASSVWRRLKR